MIGDDIISVRSDVYTDGSWHLQAPDGRIARGNAESVPAAYQQIGMKLDEWYPDVEGEATIVRLVP